MCLCKSKECPIPPFIKGINKERSSEFDLIKFIENITRKEFNGDESIIIINYLPTRTYLYLNTLPRVLVMI